MQTDNSSSEIVGSCSCGRVRYRATEDPFLVSYCHCTDCRKATGAPVTVFVGFKSADVQFKGEKPDRHRPTPTVDRLFCAICGTPIGYEDDQLPDEIYFYSSTLEDPSRYLPQLHAWVSERLDWLHIEDDLPHYERFSRQRGSKHE